MPMAKTKEKKFQWLWIIIPVVVVLFALNSPSINKLPQSQQSPTNYRSYQDNTYGFSIEYPQAWEIRNDTQVFENGDAVAFGISGPTQKERTELTDGAQVAVSIPFSIDTDLTTWAKGYFNSQAKFSQMTLTKYPFETVDDCSSHGCMTYYFTVVNDKVYGLAVFAEGLDSEKMVYENTILYMLKSFRLDSLENGVVSKEDAVAKIKALPEVIDYLKRVPNGLVLVSGEKDNAYMVQVFEVKDRHTATFNWYKVNKTTGEVKKEF